MKVSELILKLQRFDPEAYVGLLISSPGEDAKAQLVVQGVRLFEPWHIGDPIVGLVADIQNREVKP